MRINKGCNEKGDESKRRKLEGKIREERQNGAGRLMTVRTGWNRMPGGTNTVENVRQGILGWGGVDGGRVCR